MDIPARDVAVFLLIHSGGEGGGCRGYAVVKERIYSQWQKINCSSMGFTYQGRKG